MGSESSALLERTKADLPAASGRCLKRSPSRTLRLPKMFVQLANEGGGHGSQQRAVVQLESHLGADRQFLICRLQDKVITAGTAYPDSSGRFEALRIDVLSADRHDTLQDSSAIFGGSPLAEGSLRNMTCLLYTSPSPRDL